MWTQVTMTWAIDFLMAVELQSWIFSKRMSIYFSLIPNTLLLTLFSLPLSSQPLPPTPTHTRQGHIINSSNIGRAPVTVARLYNSISGGFLYGFDFELIFFLGWFWVGFGLGFSVGFFGGVWVVFVFILLISCLENQLLKWLVVVIVGWC